MASVLPPRKIEDVMEVSPYARDASPDVSFANGNTGFRFREFFVEGSKLFRRGNELFHGLLRGWSRRRPKISKTTPCKVAGAAGPLTISVTDICWRE